MTGADTVLLVDPSLPGQDCRLAKVLGFFGLPFRTLTVEQFLSTLVADEVNSGKIRLLCSAAVLSKFQAVAESSVESQRFWAERVHSAFVYAGSDSARAGALAKRLTGDEQAALHDLDRHAGDLLVSDCFDDFCGVLSGIRVKLSSTGVERGLRFDPRKANAVPIISSGQGAVFLKVLYHRVPVFLSTAPALIDLAATVATENFDVRAHFSSAAPIVLYVKWAFAKSCWNAPRTSACLMIDDPLLKRTYGFVDFKKLLQLMRSHHFATTISFIPWNWERSDPDVVRLFAENPKRLSLAVHGCDHTWGEFATQEQSLLAWRAKQAAARMDLHESRTGLRHDRIMVFPQGLFSEHALNFLKQNNFLAAVNTTLLSVGPAPRTVSISAYWEVASTHHGTFPIFTRRPPSQGIENFAFDILLGKPCLAVIHHDFCRKGYADLLEFVSQLNRLNCSLSWCGLGEVVRRSCRQRERTPGEVEIEMYGSELALENPSASQKRFSIQRRESELSAIKQVLADSQPLAWSLSEGSLSFSLELGAGQRAGVTVVFRGAGGSNLHQENRSYRFETALRRYLTEVRDDYVHPLLNGVGLLK